MLPTANLDLVYARPVGVTEVVMSSLRTLSPKYSLDSALLGDHNILRGLCVQLAQKMTPDQLPTGRETVGSIFAKDATNRLSLGSIFLENLWSHVKTSPDQLPTSVTRPVAHTPY